MPLRELWEGITSKNMREIRHMSICIRGVLNWKPNKLQLLFEGDKGEKLSVDEIKKYLYDKISDWNTTDYINQKVKNIMWNSDRKFDNYYR